MNLTPDATRDLRCTFREAWHALADGFLPPEGKVVETKIHNAQGCRNECLLKRVGRLWFFPDGSMYVYYEPTHWREIQAEATNAKGKP